MALKTNYKDDVFTGKRKYKQINNTDGTISLDDVTTYETEGDTFDANDINEINQTINSLGFVGVQTATVSTATATVTFAGNLTSDAFTFFSSVNNTNTIEQLEAMGECKPLITNVAVSGANTVVTITNKSGTAPSTAFLFDVICIRTGV